MIMKLTSMGVILFVIFQGVALAQSTAEEDAGAPQMPPPSAAPVPAEPAEAQTPAAEKSPEPITGAFGITLGERFEAAMVARVLDQQEQSYRGPEGAELEGSLFTVEPREPDERFQRYAIKTTSDGMIYAIQAEYQYEIDKSMSEQGKPKRSRKLRKTCKDAVKLVAKDYKARYGEPRGTGWDGEWYAFRQLSENTDKSLRLYANRCRSGIYSVVFTDQALLGIQAEQAKRQQKPAKEEQQEQKQASEQES